MSLFCKFKAKDLKSDHHCCIYLAFQQKPQEESESTMISTNSKAREDNEDVLATSLQENDSGDSYLNGNEMSQPLSLEHNPSYEKDSSDDNK